MGRLILALLGAATLAGAGPAAAAPALYRLDPEHLVVAFTVRHIGYHDVLGQFLKAEGSFTLDEEARTVSGIQVAIDAGSVFSNHKARDEHVRGGDFLDAARHPAIRFVGTSAEATGERTGRVTGDLTILGVTRPATLDVTLNKVGPYPFGGNYVAGVSARTTLKRSEFGMTYGVAGDLVGDEVEVMIELEAIREKAAP